MRITFHDEPPSDNGDIRSLIACEDRDTAITDETTVQQYWYEVGMARADHEERTNPDNDDYSNEGDSGEENER